MPLMGAPCRSSALPAATSTTSVRSSPALVWSAVNGGEEVLTFAATTAMAPVGASCSTTATLAFTAGCHSASVGEAVTASVALTRMSISVLPAATSTSARPSLPLAWSDVAVGEAVLTLTAMAPVVAFALASCPTITFGPERTAPVAFTSSNCGWRIIVPAVRTGGRGGVWVCLSVLAVRAVFTAFVDAAGGALMITLG